MALIIGLPEKEIQKVNKDLYELHKRVILNYLLSRIFLYTYTYIRSAFNPKRIMEMPKISQRY